MSRLEYKVRILKGEIFQLKRKHGFTDAEAYKFIAKEKENEKNIPTRKCQLSKKALKRLRRDSRNRHKRTKKRYSPFQYSSPSRSKRVPAGGRLILAGSPGSGKRS